MIFWLSALALLLYLLPLRMVARLSVRAKFLHEQEVANMALGQDILTAVTALSTSVDELTQAVQGATVTSAEKDAILAGLASDKAKVDGLVDALTAPPPPAA